jgi:hypothetical protein
MRKEITEDQILQFLAHMKDGWSPKIASAKVEIHWSKHSHLFLKDKRVIKALLAYNHTRDHKTKLYPIPKTKE